MSLGDLLSDQAEESKPLCVVRLRRSSWADSRGAYLRTDIIAMKRLSKGFNIFLNDLSEVGSGEVIPRILNLDYCKDGVYKLITCNESRDSETGYIESYEYRLIPYEPEEKLP